MSKGISEIYPCLQGEGRHAGIPSILIRTLGCNLRCVWCDTPFTSWKVEKGSFSTKDVITAFENNPQIEKVIITGGEPCIYPEIENLIDLCKQHNKHITLETNGTQTLTKSLMKEIDLVSISPKLSNSTPVGTSWAEQHDKARIHQAAIREWIQLAKNYQLKFVVCQLNDLVEIKELIAQVGTSNRQVYLMPEGTTQKQLQEKRQWLAESCIREGFCYCERLHVVIYGDKRGV